MPSAVNQAGFFLVSTLFDIYIFILLLRIILVATRINYFNPVSQFISRVTQFIVNPLRRVIPNVKNIETASIVLVIVLEMVKFFLISLLLIGFPNPLGLIILSVADALKATANIYFYGILIQAILSWIPTMGYSPILSVVSQITQPVIRPFQRIVPLVGGVDISPIPAMIVIQLLIILLISPLLAFGQMMAFG